MPNHSEIPSKIFIVIFTAVFGLFTFSVKKNYDYTLKSCQSVKADMKNAFSKIPEAWVEDYRENIKFRDTTFKLLTNIYQTLNKNKDWNPGDRTIITIDYILNKLKISEELIIRIPIDSNDLDPLLKKIMANEKTNFRAQYNCWAVFKNYIKLIESQKYSKKEIAIKRNEFCLSYNNLIFYSKINRTDLQASYNEVTQFEWPDLEEIFWYITGLISFGAVIYLIKAGIQIYIISNRS